MIVMRKLYMILAVLALAVSCAGAGQNLEKQAENVCEEVSWPLGFCTDSLDVVEGKVKNGQFFSTLLGSLGMSAQDAYNLTQACSDVFDVKTLRVGNSYQAYYSEQDSLEYLVYDREPEKKKYYFNNKILIRENL